MPSFREIIASNIFDGYPPSLKVSFFLTIEKDEELLGFVRDYDYSNPKRPDS
jgi:hypothetical protein